MTITSYYIRFLILSLAVMAVAHRISKNKRFAPWAMAGCLLALLSFLYFQIVPHGLLPILFGQGQWGIMLYYHWVAWPVCAFLLLSRFSFSHRTYSYWALTILALIPPGVAAFDLTHYFTHLNHRFLSDTNAPHLTAQSSDYSCVPTSMANLLRLYGVQATEREMAKLSLTHSGETGGTNLAGVYYGLQTKAEGRYQVVIRRLSIDELKQLPHPAMITKKLHLFFYHSWLYLHYDGEKFHIYDPLLGRVMFYGEEILSQYWRGDAVYLVEEYGK